MTAPRKAAKPRYQQLKEQIVARIMSGVIRPGDRVPSENELVGSAGVSRMTANRALRELTDEGYVERVPGVGSFVADKAASHVLEVRNIADEILHRGHRHSAVVLLCVKESADAEVAHALQMSVGSPVFHLRVIHHENAAPIQFEERFVDIAFAPRLLEQDFSKTTPSAYLSQVAPLQEAEQVVRAMQPERTIRDRLAMRAHEPCLLVIRRTWVSGRPASFARLYHPGHRFELTGHFVPPGTPAARRGKADLRHAMSELQ